MESPAEPPAERKEFRANARRPWFQYSLKTLLWFVTGCAVISAILGWIGPEWGLAVLIGSPHIALWAFIVTGRALGVFQKQTEPLTVSGELTAVVWTILLYVVLMSGGVLGHGAIEMYRSPPGPFPFLDNIGGVLMMEVIFLAWLFIFSAIALLVAAAFSVCVSLILLAWNDPPKTHASLVGGATGAVFAFFCTCYNTISLLGPLDAPFHLEPIEWFAGVILPIVMGFVLPPLFIAWADRRGRFSQQAEPLQTVHLETEDR